MNSRTLLRLPEQLSLTIDAHKQWLDILRNAEATVELDAYVQRSCKGTAWLEGRSLPPEVLGRSYAAYCSLINKMYDAYLNSVHLQRSPYIADIITLFVKRMYELRNELVHVIVNDYIYVDAALTGLRMTPFDLEIVIPYHFPKESRSENVEQALQKMWAAAIRRKRPKKPKPKIILSKSLSILRSRSFASQQRIEQVKSIEEVAEEDEEEETPPPSVHSLIPEEHIQAVMIQKHERFRQWLVVNLKEKNRHRRQYFGQNIVEPPIELKEKAARIIQKVYREFMKIKRERVRDTKRDVLIGMLPDPCRSGKLDYKIENDKIYERRRNTRLKIKPTYLEELEKENTRLILFKKDNQIDDITEQIREWFKEWYYGYGFFPQYPHELEGGTLLVMRGQYITIDEKQEQDKLLAKEVGNETSKQGRAMAKADAKLKAKADLIQAKKEAMALVKARCDPFSDPGYQVKASKNMDTILEALREYRKSWSIHDQFPSKRFGETIYGYMKPLLIENLMCQMHIDCRKYVDELMRLELKILVQAHQAMYARMKWTFPKVKPPKIPKVPAVPKSIVLDTKLLKSLEPVFDLGIVTKPTTKMSDVFGDYNFAAYEYNIRDPNAEFPPPAYGDIKRRLILSCALACGIQPGATRNKAVMLLGPERNGKSFLVDAVAGELNAVKIDITPEVFSALLAKPAKVLTRVFVAAKAFQPAVVFMKNIERVFSKKVPPEEKHLQAALLKPVLAKLVKSIPENEKVIFIATCSNPFVAQERPMTSMFNEIILVPRADQGSLHKFFSDHFQREISVPTNFPVMPIARLCSGFGFGVIIEAYNEVMTDERRVTMNINPLSPGEFLEAVMSKGELLTAEEYKQYVDFFIENSPLKTERIEYAEINRRREDAYLKMAKKTAKEGAKKKE